MFNEKTRRIAALEGEVRHAEATARSYRAMYDDLKKQMLAATDMLRLPPTMTTSMQSDVGVPGEIVNGWQKVGTDITLGTVRFGG